MYSFIYSLTQKWFNQEFTNILFYICKCKVEIRSLWSSLVVNIVLHYFWDSKVDSVIDLGH